MSNALESSQIIFYKTLFYIYVQELLSLNVFFLNFALIYESHEPWDLTFIDHEISPHSYESCQKITRWDTLRFCASWGENSAFFVKTSHKKFLKSIDP